MAVNIAGLSGDIYRSVKTLFETPAGTVVFDRNYGMNWDGVDQPLEIAETMMMTEAEEKLEVYEPRVEIQDMITTLDPDGETGIEVILAYADQE